MQFKQKVQHLAKFTNESIKNAENICSSVLGERLVDFLSGELGIRLFAVDFDGTMIDGQTGGKLHLKKEKSMLQGLSKEFNDMATYAQKKYKINTCCVTFNDENFISSDSSNYIAGEPLVRKVMDVCEASFDLNKVYPYYPHFFHRPYQFEKLGLTSPMENSKNDHLRMAMKDYDITNPAEVLLIDDNYDNCYAAVSQGYFAMCIQPASGYRHNRIFIDHRWF